MVKAPEDPKGELIAAGIIKGLVSSVPVLGGVISELGDQYFNPAIVRRHAWEHEVSFAVTRIEERFNRLPQELLENELFCSLVMQATGIAITTHRHEKRVALRNILISAAQPDVDEDVLTQFVQYIGEFTPTHIALLRLVRHNEERLANSRPNLDSFYELALQSGLYLERSTFRSFVRDLENRFLLNLRDTLEFEEFQSGRDYLESEGSTLNLAEVTALGRSFLDHIDQE